MNHLRQIFEDLSDAFPTPEEINNPALAIVQSRPDDVLDLAHEKTHAYHYSHVPQIWGELYTEASIWKAAKLFKTRLPGWETRIVQVLDRALIMTPGIRRNEEIQRILVALDGIVSYSPEGTLDRCEREDETPPVKRRKLGDACDNVASEFTAMHPGFNISTEHKIPVLENPDYETFQKYLDPFQNSQGPIIITNHNAESRAFTHWQNPRYLLSKTLGGRRLVPVEVGRSYTDQDWKPEIIPIGDLIKNYMLRESTPPSQKRVYLAQHDLFGQIPSLKEDVIDPIYCLAPSLYGETLNGTHKVESSYSRDNAHKATTTISLPPLTRNIWLGPSHTVSPLHHDSRNNILVQVFGYKYIRLYPRAHMAFLYPLSTDVNGVDMSNTSRIDLDVVLQSDEIEGTGIGLDVSVGEDPEDVKLARKTLDEEFPEFGKARYVECVLGPGECLFIPQKWWHYVRSLTPSCSVSYWFGEEGDTL